MAKQLVAFTPERAKRLVDATQQAERLLGRLADATGMPPREATPGVWVLNTHSAAAPPGALLAVLDSYYDSALGRHIVKVGRPDTTLRTTYLVSGVEEIPAGEPWFLPFASEAHVQHDPDWTPEPGQSGGPKPGSWLLHEGYPGCFEVLGVRDAEAHVVTGHLRRIDAVWGKAQSDLDPASGTTPATGTVIAWYFDGTEFVATEFELEGTNEHAYKIKAGRLFRWIAIGAQFVAAPAARTWAGTIAAPVGAGGTTTVVLSDGTSHPGALNVSGQELEAGSVLAAEDGYNGGILITGAAPGGRKFWRCGIIDDIPPGSTGTIQLSDTSIGTGGNVEAENCSNSDPGVAGSRGFAWKDVDDLYYFVGDGLRWFLAELDADLEASDLTAAVTNVVCISGGSVPGSLTDVDNQFSDSGFEGDRVLFVESPNAGSEKYCLVRVKARRVSRRYKATLSADLASGSSSAAVTGVTALDGEPAPTITSVLNPHSYSGESGAACEFEEDWSSVTEGVPAYILYAMKHVVVTVVTDYRYDTSSHKLQKKTRKITVMHEEDESEWTDVRAFTGYTAVTAVDWSSPNLTKKTRLLFCPEAGTESSATNVLSFEQITVVSDTMVESGVLKHKDRTAYVVSPSSETTDTVFTPPTQSVVIDVFDGTTYVGQTKATLSVWATMEGSSSTVVNIETCE